MQCLRQPDRRAHIPNYRTAGIPALVGLTLVLALAGCSPPESAVARAEAHRPVRSPLSITPALVSLANAAPSSLDAAERENVVGAAVYRATCALCHGPGIAGAPRLDRREDWRQRIVAGSDTLVNHAISGYRGEHGLMPARGGNPSLGDDEVRAAVDYMLSRVSADIVPAGTALD